jgi:hypothetical protein
VSPATPIPGTTWTTRRPPPARPHWESTSWLSPPRTTPLAWRRPAPDAPRHRGAPLGRVLRPSRRELARTTPATTRARTVDRSDSFDTARDRLSREGLRVDGWVVLTHDDDLDDASRDLLVRNAYGESYSYALCPRNDDVRDYCRTLVQEVLRGGGLRGVVLEACGPMGLDHGGAHDKVSMAGGAPIEVNFCRSASVEPVKGALANLGIDPVDLSRTIREGLARGVTSMEEALGEVSPAVAQYRVSLSTTLQSDLLEAARAVDPRRHAHRARQRESVGHGVVPEHFPRGAHRATCAVANCWTPQRRRGTSTSWAR